jgi:hypothetical protein
MRRRDRGVLVGVLAGMLGLVAATASAQVMELQGAWLIDGYTFQPGDRSPRGTIAYDSDANVFTGTYVGLKLPADRADLHAWLYDTRTKAAHHLGRIDYRAGTTGKDKGTFRLALPAGVRGGAFSPYEIVAFSAEVPGAKPSEPSGSKIQPNLKPAFYLYAPLPGSKVPGVYCGHGQDFSYTSDLQHNCFD